MGTRFAFTGGREGWGRVLLTAVGVGLGVALLLLTAAIPSALTARHDRESARTDITFSDVRKPKADNTLIVANVGTTFRKKNVRGRELEPNPGGPSFGAHKPLNNSRLLVGRSGGLVRLWVTTKKASASHPRACQSIDPAATTRPATTRDPLR